MDQSDLQSIANRFRYEIAELVAVSRALSSERDIKKLLALILEKCRQVTGADAGSVYVVEGEGEPAERKLHFMLSQNDSLAIDFQELALGIDEKSIVGKAVLTAKPINIPDLSRLSETGQNPWGFQHNRSFDEKTGYRGRSMLTVPMSSATGEVIGVIQLINRKRDAGARLSAPSHFEEQVIPFDQRTEEFALALASQAGLSLENALLYDEIKNLFEGFVEASVMAIEARDPTTSGHSRRVATLSLALAERVDAVSTGPLAGVHFTPTAMKQLEYAGVLHDFGKVGVREKVLVKARKLYDEDRRAIEMRLAYVKKSLEAEHTEEKLRLALDMPREILSDRFAELDVDLARRRAEIEEVWSFVLSANEPSVVEAAGLERIMEIGRMTYVAPDGEWRSYLEQDELAALQVRRGSLTDVERLEIESHVVHTRNFLNRIPWGRRFADVPRIAGAHHEYLNGRGYPNRLAASDIPWSRAS